MIDAHVTEDSKFVSILLMISYVTLKTGIVHIKCNLFTVITLGTMKAACDLLEKASANILDCLVIIELSDLKGRDKVPKNVSSLMQY